VSAGDVEILPVAANSAHGVRDMGARGGRKVVGFAGGGGSSVAVRLALNCDPDLAMNHWMVAISAHQRHFPGTDHHCADIFDVDPREFRPGERISFGWFSPDCTDFSKAKGGAPRSARIRGLAWSVLPWAVTRRIEVIMVENVEEFLTWGPVYREGQDGKVGEPIPERRGETFARWKGRLEKLGYVVEWRVLNAADYGAPTTRKRLYVIARCDGRPIVWPERTHAPRGECEALGLQPWRGACEILDWSVPCPSLFLTPAECDDLRHQTGRRVKRPVVSATQRRVFRGIDRYVVGAARPFLAPVQHAGDARVYDPADPLRTVTSVAGGEFALVQPFIAPITHHDGRDRVSSSDDPLRTITSAKGGEFSIVQPTVAHVIKFQENSIGTKMTEPLHTVMSGATRHGIVETSLTSAFLGRQFGSTVSGRDIEDPAPTVMSGGGGGKTQVVAAHLGSYYATGIGSDCAEPVRAATAQARHALTVAFLEQANTGMVGHEAVEPLSTIVGRGTTQRLVEAQLAREGGPTGRRAAVLEFLWRHAGEPTEAEWADPLATHAGRLKFGLVVIEDQVWMIVDIGLRMLLPKELAAAMGLPPEYDLGVDVYGQKVSKTHQTQMIGNMVSPPPAVALIRANCPHLVEPGVRAAA